MTVFVVRQLPVPPPERYSELCPWSLQENLAAWIRVRVAELIMTARDILTFANTLELQPRPFQWDKGRRLLLRCELDAAFFHIYGIGREDVDYVMETFPIVHRNDESAYCRFQSSIRPLTPCR